MKTVEVIAPTSKTECLKENKKNKLLKVCAYARVSTDSEDQKSSYESQIIHYKTMIEENPNWEFVRVYADEGITGTQTKKRDFFNQMMKDSLNKKIDLILSKSISRFARNTVDTLNCVRLLRDHNVDVFFEKENIHTLGLSNELFLTLYSAFAQAESESISENVKAGAKMKMKQGRFVGQYAPYGYLYDKDTKEEIITIDETKREIIVDIFESYAKGIGFRTISDNLNAKGIPSPHGLKWCHSGVRRIITNEKYVGDLVTGKNYSVNVIAHKRKINYGEKELYYTSEHHEAIISRELWNECQKILKIRGTKMLATGNRDKFSLRYSFSSKTFCGCCGERFIRRSYKKSRKNPNSDEVAYWICRSHRNNIECSNYINYKEEELKEIFVNVFNELFKDIDKYIKTFQKKIDEVISDKKSDNSKSIIQNQITILNKKSSDLIDLRLDNSITKEMFDMKQKEIASKIMELENEFDSLKDIAETRKIKMNQINKINEVLNTYKKIDTFDDEIFKTLVDKIIIGEVSCNETENLFKIKFILKTGEMIVNNISNNKLEMGEELGQYGFTLKKQEDNDNITVYVLERRNRNTHIPYTFTTLDIMNFNYRLNDKFTTKFLIKDNLVSSIYKINITIAVGL